MFDVKDVEHVFQPIYSLEQQQTIGFEAFMRHKFFAQPQVLFKVARELDKLYWLDTLSIEKAVSTFNFANDSYLFLNIFPTTILSSRFPEFLQRCMKTHAINPSKTVLELNETSKEEDVWYSPALKERIASLRQCGFMIAIDDVGIGAASLKQVIEMQPDMIKLDRYFSLNLAHSESKQELLSLFVNFCKSQQSTLVLEGVEESVDYITANKLNVPLVQGYYIGKPLPYKQLHKT